MMKRGVVQPSQSPWASPVVLVAKKDSSTRFCVDYRKLNAITKMDVYPLPRIDDSLDQLAHAKHFSTLDILTGYWQVKMEEASQEKTAFTVCLFEFRVMPFSLCNVPATFQRLMENVLPGLVRDQCIVYIDNILAIGKHLENLQKVFGRLHQAGLRLKPSKCRLAQQSVEYLGYVMSEPGIDPKKVDCGVLSQAGQSPIPQIVFGSCLLLPEIHPWFFRSAQPLYVLTKKNVPFEWTQPCQNAFDELKWMMTEAPVLEFPDFEREFVPKQMLLGQAWELYFPKSKEMKH